MKNRITPKKVIKLEKYDIFVFGSNLAGIHGAGAAKLAYDKTWAQWGLGYGIHYSNKGIFGSYAIPTKGLYIEDLSIEWIQYYITHSIDWWKKYPQLKFLVTEIGCGLGNKTPEQIAPLFKEAVNVENIHLPQRFWDILNKTK